MPLLLDPPVGTCQPTRVPEQPIISLEFESSLLLFCVALEQGNSQLWDWSILKDNLQLPLTLGYQTTQMQHKENMPWEMDPLYY